MKYKFLLFTAIIVNATGLLGGVMEPDSALYAYIAKQMAQHNDFINLYNSTDWLDKPHFPFWIIACSFKILGITSFAYKLPAFLFWLIALRYLYKLGKALFNQQTAMIAVLIYATAFQAVVGLFDVRGEHYLTALMLAAVYYLYQLYHTGKIKYVWLAALFSACAVMTKGLFFLTTITSGFIVMIIIQKEWQQFANYKWYLYLFLTLIFIIPELYCLYTQFDLHPEKIIYGKTNVSGLRFFFWDSQFGRFLNTGPIKGEGNIFFFTTIFWAFLPWSIVLCAAIVRLVKERKVLYKSSQWIITGSAIVTFIIFCLSQFQLPHYWIILFPHFSLLCADYLVKKQETKAMHSFIITERLLLIFCLLALVTMTMIFGLPHYLFIIIISILVASAFLYISQEFNLTSFICLGVGFCAIANLFLNLSFYPALLQYQSGETAAKWFNETVKSAELGLFKTEDFSLKFYANNKIISTDTLPVKTEKKQLIKYYFTTKKNIDSLMKTGLPVTQLKSFSNFHISELNAAFLYKNIRSSQLDTTIIFTINK